MEIITVINQKGGTGKTTTAHAIGAGLFLKGYKVLFIDLDAQCNLTYTMGAENSKPAITTLLQQIIDEQQPQTAQAIHHTAQGDIIPSSSNIASTDTILADITGREYKLTEILKPIKNNYDYIIIDTPPTLGILTINALTAATKVIATAQADAYSLIALKQLYTTLSTVKKYCNSDLIFEGIVLTRYNGRAIISRELAERIETTAQAFNTKLFKTRIRECTAIKEAEIMQQSIFTYAPKSNAAADYSALISEILREDI